MFPFPLRESNYYHDAETNQRYAMFRDCYDPATGRFCQPDPIGVEGIAGRNGIFDPRSMSGLGFDAFDLAQLSDEDITFIRGLTYSRPSFISDYNLYLYGNGNPLSRIDPDGLFPVDPTCGVISDMCKQAGKNWRAIVFYILCSIGDRRPPPPPPRPSRPPLENPAPPKPPGPPPPKPPAAPPTK